MITYIKMSLLWILQVTNKLDGRDQLIRLPYMGIMYCQVCFVDNNCYQLFTVYHSGGTYAY